MCTPYGYFDSFEAGIQSSDAQLEQLFSDSSELESCGGKQAQQPVVSARQEPLSQYSLDSLYNTQENEFESREVLASKNSVKERCFLKFPQKLWSMMNCCSSEAIKWGPEGDTIVIDYDAFQEEFLNENQSVFKTRNFASFIRQLNLYGFRKVNHSHSSQVNSKMQILHEFKHEYFQRGNEELLANVTRKYTSPPAPGEPSIRTRTATNSLKFRTVKRNVFNFKKAKRRHQKGNSEKMELMDKNKVEKCHKLFDDLLDKQREAYKSKSHKFAKFAHKKRSLKPKRTVASTGRDISLSETPLDEAKPLIICEDPVWNPQLYSQSSQQSSVNVNVIMDPSITPTKAQSFQSEIIEELVYDSVFGQFDHMLAGGDTVAIVSTTDQLPSGVFKQ